ncbi:hypothetical protein EV666_111145 [Camelimonas lactis]|uniref:Uncharacterized protein n=1 Tax=Camelimonas lactis TaxID=659006 RepID=A0A4R2GQ67_9HYPH|nr:hypothetical protein EV666_111145 [Camelimonas lactis]
MRPRRRALAARREQRAAGRVLRRQPADGNWMARATAPFVLGAEGWETDRAAAPHPARRRMDASAAPRKAGAAWEAPGPGAAQVRPDAAQVRPGAACKIRARRSLGSTKSPSPVAEQYDARQQKRRPGPPFLRANPAPQPEPCPCVHARPDVWRRVMRPSRLSWRRRPSSRSRASGRARPATARKPKPWRGSRPGRRGARPCGGRRR